MPFESSFLNESVKKEILKEHIKSLRQEISIHLVGSKSLTADGYFEKKRTLENLQNLLSIAENELHALYHHYKITLTGEVLSRHGKRSKQVWRRNLFLETDYRLSSFDNKNISGSLDTELLTIIMYNYSNKFIDGRFEVTRVKQIR